MGKSKGLKKLHHDLTLLVFWVKLCLLAGFISLLAFGINLWLTLYVNIEKAKVAVKFFESIGR